MSEAIAEVPGILLLASPGSQDARPIWLGLAVRVGVRPRGDRLRAYWSCRDALEDERVMAVFMLGTGTPLTHRAHEALDRALERALQRLAR